MELKIELNVKGLDKLADAILALAETKGGKVEAVATTTKKLEDPAEISDVEAVAPTPVNCAPESEKTVEVDKPTVKIDADYLKALCLTISKAKKTDKCKKILKTFNLERVSDVAVEQYEALKKALEDLANA